MLINTNMNAYMLCLNYVSLLMFSFFVNVKKGKKGEHIMLINIFLNMHKFKGSILDSFDRCFVIIKNEEIVEPLFDFDDIKTLVLLFLIKLLGILEMNLTPKAKVSFKVLKIQHPRDGFESPM